MDDRRGRARYRVWFPMTLVLASGEESTAITYDASASGLLMACPSRVPPGTSLTIRFHITLEDEPRELAAEVLRAEAGEDPASPWAYLMAVRFTEEHPELEELLIAHSEEPPEGGGG